MQYTQMAILSRSDFVPPFAFANAQNNIFLDIMERERFIFEMSNDVYPQIRIRGEFARLPNVLPLNF